jgi:hypothetical protein
MTTAELLAKNKIQIESTAPGDYATTCPQCSHNRKPENQDKKCLGVHIDTKGACWHCNHCGWAGPEKGSGNSKRPELQSYLYRDADGVVRFRKIRNLPGREPRFWLERPGGKGGWLKGTKGVDTKILYRADEVKKAIGEGRLIAVVEGEKDANNLWAIGIAATCNAHGAQDITKTNKPKWYSEHTVQLEGADVVIMNDNDPAGYAHADAAGGDLILFNIAKRVRRLDLKPHWPDIPKGGDVSDWLAVGGEHTPERLRELIANTPDYDGEATSHYAPQEEGQAGEETVSETKTDAGQIDEDVELQRLARLTVRQYEQQRKEAAKRLEVRAPVLDKLVAAKRVELGFDEDDGKQGRAVELPEPEPWPEPVDGAAMLDGIAAAIRKHVVMSDTSRDTSALWAVHAYLLDCFLVSPRLGVRSPTKRCGKTTLEDVLSRLVPRPLPTANVTPAALFRVVEAYRPTLLIDEADTFLYDDDELRGLINSGHRKGGTVLRTVGDDHEPRAFSTYSAVVIALIGTLPDTINDRAVPVDLKRRLRSEPIEPFRPDRAGHLDELARKAARWTQDNAEAVAAADPEMPDGVINRAADNWRVLLAIADVAQGEWPERARKAALAAHAAGEDDDASRLEMLLGDIRQVFTEKNVPEIGSQALVKALIRLEGRPWREMGKAAKPLTQNKLARMLVPVKITPEKVGPREKRISGYVREHFKDAFARYLEPEGVFKADNRTQCDETGTSDIFKPDTVQSECPVAKSEKPNNDGLLSGCPVAKGDEGPKARAGANGQGAQPASKRVRRVTAWGVSFGVVGPAPPGATCLYCHEATPDEIGGVMLVEGCGRLHEGCAPAWISNENRSK